MIVSENEIKTYRLLDLDLDLTVNLILLNFVRRKRERLLTDRLLYHSYP